MVGKTKRTVNDTSHQVSTAKQAAGTDTVSPAKSKKSNAQRAKQRAAARKVRKNKLLTLLSWYDKSLKEGNKKAVAKLLAAFKAAQLARPDIDRLRTVVNELKRALESVDKQIKKFPTDITRSEKNKPAPSRERNQKELKAAEKKLGEAQQRLKKAQTAEQVYFADITKKQAKNGACPFCQIKRISVDSHVMDMHSHRWGEYLTMLEK